MSKIDLIESDYVKKSIPDFNVGDEVKVSLKVQEGDKTRTQVFQGIVIRRRGRGTGASFAVLKEIRDDTVEKNFALHSPHIEKIAVVKKGDVRRSKLYYLRRNKPGKS